MTCLVRALRAVAVSVVASLAACSPQGERGTDSAQAADALAVDSAHARNTVVRAEDPEARAWLAPGDDKVTLAGNRFDSTVDAAQFVDMLYAEGAEQVVIAAESIREERGGLMADAIRVVLPADRDQRASLFRILNAEAAEGGFDAEEDSGQQVYYMWWD